jgi:hypothetical protein
MRWGLGIEHEMKLRFEKSLDKIPSHISIDILRYDFSKESSYLFLSAETALFYFYIYESQLERPVKINHPYEKKYILKQKIFRMAKAGKKYPFHDPNFYIPGVDHFIKNITFFEFYMFIYRLYHFPEGLMGIHIETLHPEYSTDISLELFFPYSRYIYENRTDELLRDIESFYDGTYIKKYKVYFYKFLSFKKKYYYHIAYKSFYNKNPIIYPILILNETSDSIPSFDGSWVKAIFKSYAQQMKQFFLKKVKLRLDNKKLRTLSDLYFHVIPNIDSSLFSNEVIEFQTISYDTLNFQKVLDDFLFQEETFFYVLNHLPCFQELTKHLGKIQYHATGSMGKMYQLISLSPAYSIILEEDYMGSYHIWVTCPHENDISMEEFTQIHATLGNRFQLLEPVFSSHFTSPSANALGQSKKYAKSSFRHFVSNTINYGTSDVSLIQGSSLFYIDRYYLSEEDILYDKYVEHKSSLYMDKKFYFPVFDKNGKPLLNYSKLDERIVTSNMYKSVESGNLESVSIPGIMNYYQQLIQNNKEYARIKLLGADIRTKNLQNEYYGLKSSEFPCYLFRDGKYYLYIYDADKKKVKDFDLPSNSGNAKNWIGIEFRILDHFPTPFLNQMISLLSRMALYTSDTYKKITSKEMYINKQMWQDNMYQSILQGYEYHAPRSYIQWIENEFGVSISSPRQTYDSTYILSALHMQLTHKLMHSKNKKIRDLYPKLVYQPEVTFVNLNRLAWFEIIQQFLKKQNLNVTNCSLSQIKNALFSLRGEKNTENISKIKNYIIYYSNTPK